MKKIIESILAIGTLLFILYASKLYFKHFHNPVEYVIDKVIMNATGIDIGDYLPMD
jgi:hypothetical protein